MGFFVVFFSLKTLRALETGFERNNIFMNIIEFCEYWVFFITHAFFTIISL